MTTLSQLLTRLVPAPPGASARGAIARAEHAGRIVGAIAVAAAEASGCGPATAAALLSLLRPRPQWGLATARAIRALARAPGAHPLAPWASLLSPDEEARGVDRWHLDFDATLRHAGLEPARAPGAFGAELTDRLRELRDAVLAALPGELVLEGEGPGTTARVADLRFGVAPLLELHGDAVWMWDGAASDRKPGSWLSVWADRDDDPPAPPSGPAASAWRDAGVLARLRSRADIHPLAPFAGDGPAPVDLGSCAGAALVLELADPASYAERVAAGARCPERPVIVVRVGAGEDAVRALDAALGTEGDEAAAALRSWRDGAGHDRPAVLAACDTAETSGLDALRALCDGAPLAVVTRRHVYDQQWPPDLRAQWKAVPLPVSEPDGAIPERVADALAKGTAPRTAWREALEEELRIDARGFGAADHVAFLVRLLEGEDDLMSVVARDAADALLLAPGLAWWQRGLLAVTPDGRVELVHPGFAALAAGLLAGARGAAPEVPRLHGAHADAWSAGVELGARVAGSLAATHPPRARRS